MQTTRKLDDGSHARQTAPYRVASLVLGSVTTLQFSLTGMWMFGFTNVGIYSILFPYRVCGVESLFAISVYPLMYAFPDFYAS